MQPTRTLLQLAAGVCALAFFNHALCAAPVSVTRLDGVARAGELRDIADGVVTIETADGPERFSFDDVAAIEIIDCPSPPPPVGEAWFALAGGGALRGALVDGGNEQIVARTALAERTVLPFGELAAVRLRDDRVHDAAGLFAAALADRQAGSDVLIALDEGGAKALRGRLTTLGPEEGTFVFGERQRQFRTAKVFGVVFATGARTAMRDPFALTLATGDALAAKRVETRGDVLHVETAFGQSFDVPLMQVCALRMASERVIYLSSLAPESESSQGIVHPAWPIVRDGNVLHEPLSIGGQRFAQGLGVHARAQMVYQLGGKYETFAATIGIDDAVRPGGSVEFVVRGDGQELFTSGPLTGADPPRTLRVPVAGVNLLTLIVEPGTHADVGDWADWGGARVILPAGAVTMLSQTVRE